MMSGSTIKVAITVLDVVTPIVIFKFVPRMRHVDRCARSAE